MFKFISKVDKQFLNVSWETHGNGATCPDQFLSAQSKDWAKFWYPKGIDPEIDNKIGESLKHLRNAALEAAQDISFGAPELDRALKGYRKETMGCDMWKPSELRGLPQVAKSEIAFSIQQSMRSVASPHQHLLFLNPLLGKPNKSCRTICKTPVLYRMALRADQSVKEWEITNTQPYDKASAGSSSLLAALKRNLKS